MKSSRQRVLANGMQCASHVLVPSAASASGEFLAMIVAVIGAILSAYLYT